MDKKRRGMMRELWDLVDEDRRPLRIKHVRGKKLPHDTYHLVVFVWTVSFDGRFLITKRSPNKPWGEFWENTGGSVLAGESREQGAVRELYEETGVKIVTQDLILIHEERSRSAFEDTFLTFVDKSKQTIRLQANETIDHKWISYQELMKMFDEGHFALPVYNRFKSCQDKLLDELWKANIKYE